MYRAYHCLTPSAETTSPTRVLATFATSVPAALVTLPKTSVMKDSRSPSSPLPLVDPVLAVPVDWGVRSEEIDAKNEDISETPGRLRSRSLTTGVGMPD